MQTQDYYKPTNIRETIFTGIELPEKSKILTNFNRSKYQQQEVNDFDIGISNLGQISVIQNHKNHETSLSVHEKVNNLEKEAINSNSITRPNSSQVLNNSDKSDSQTNHFLTIRNQQLKKTSAASKGKNNPKKPISQKKPVDLDQQIGQVSEWAHRDQDQKSSDFDKSDQKDYGEQKNNKEEQEKYRKIAEEKAKMYSMRIQKKQNGSQPKGLGLKAKAEELKKKKQQSMQSLPKIEEGSYEQSTDHQKISLKNQQQKVKLEQGKSAHALKAIQDQAYEKEEDPWDKINQKTQKQYQKKKELENQPLKKQDILQFYQKRFIFVKEDIQVKQVVGCWQALFGCFKTKSETTNKKSRNTIDNLALRLIAISQIELSNTAQQFFILKEIWTKLTGKPFARYGNHWNQIGFQGRDPKTDLRSTGVLSLLQWYLFIEQDLVSAKKIYEWTVEKGFPLALTHIKSTGLFLQLLKKGKIRAKSWNQYQKYYNCISWGVFKKIQEEFDETENVGEVVDRNLEKIAKNLTQILNQYNQKMKS